MSLKLRHYVGQIKLIVKSAGMDLYALCRSQPYSTAASLEDAKKLNRLKLCELRLSFYNCIRNTYLDWKSVTESLL